MSKKQGTYYPKWLQDVDNDDFISFLETFCKDKKIKKTDLITRDLKEASKEFNENKICP